MSEFLPFAKIVNSRVADFIKNPKDGIFYTKVNGDDLYLKYLNSFRPGDNPIYINRTEHDCSACKSFIRAIGSMVRVSGETIETIWDEVDPSDEVYYPVAQALKKLVLSANISSVFHAGVPSYGSAPNSGFSHFHATRLPMLTPAKVAAALENRNMLQRSIEEFTAEALATVKTFIDENLVYRIDTNATLFNDFMKVRARLSKYKNKDVGYWVQGQKNSSVSRIRNTSFGTLLIDLSSGMDVNRAVKRYEDMVAPSNYRRTSALVSSKQIELAKKRIDELGLSDAMSMRRHANESDMRRDMLLFSNSSFQAPIRGDIFDTLKPNKPKVSKKPANTTTIGVDEFINNIVQDADSIELDTTSHDSRFMTLITSDATNSDKLFSWGNRLSWSYINGVTDAITERVKQAGGVVNAPIRFSLAWDNTDDLDLSVRKNNSTIFYADRKKLGGELDVDANRSSLGATTSPVENIFWSDLDKFTDGEYFVRVDNFNRRNNSGAAVLQLNILGDVYTFEFKNARNSGAKDVARVVRCGSAFRVYDCTTNKVMKPSTGVGNEVWGIKLGELAPVEMVALSPNVGDDGATGLVHMFFILKDCLCPSGAKGFYNEFLTPELKDHRKVIEMLVTNNEVEYTEHQLSGIGFSLSNKTKFDVVVTKNGVKTQYTVEI